MGRMVQFREWTAGSALRKALVGGAFLLLIVATLATWLYLASLAVSPNLPTLADALQAYDQQEYEVARLLIAQLTEHGNMEMDELGGPLFVLGVVKAAQAENQWSAQHRQSQYLIAAKYLREAHDLGFPLGREEEGNYLLGRSLIESGENAAGLASLEEALSLSSTGSTRLHLMLAKAYRLTDPAQVEAAIQHVETALADPKSQGADRRSALLDRIAMLSEQRRFSEARQALNELSPSDSASPAAELATGSLDLAEAKDKLRSVAPDSEASQLLRDQIASAARRLASISSSDVSSEEAMYLVGEAHALLGDTVAAVRQFERVRKQFPSSPLGIAASIAEGDLYRAKKRNYQLALAAYRRALTALEEPKAYRNRFLPLSQLKKNIVAAHAAFLGADEFELAATLVEHLSPTFSRSRQLELRAATLSEWGRALLVDARRGNGNVETIHRLARFRFREAGAAFEELASRQFATPFYPRAVWNSAENYFRGQNYTNAIRQFNEYLKNEPVKQNALALLRLGQSHLARDEPALGIEALEECIELHPYDAAIYQARLDCAKAYRNQGDIHHAEQLLLANLNGSGQAPNSPEWRDSLFELGYLLHNAGRHDEAIGRLDEAIQRYEEADQVWLAMYLIGESHRHEAEKPLAELETAKTVNDREKGTEKAQHHLAEALRYYEKVWRAITSADETNPLDRAMLRNCYMLRGSVLFDLGRVEGSPDRFKEAIDAYSNVSTLYQSEPFVLETFVQIANCQRRLHEPMKARMNIDRALQLLDQMPPDADFLAATNFNRSEWKSLLTQMRDW